MSWIYYFLIAFLVVQLFIWRKLVSTSADLVTVATTLASAANALTAAANAVATLVKNLQTGQVVDQATLDSVVTSLDTSVKTIQAASTELSNLVPTTPTA